MYQHTHTHTQHETIQSNKTNKQIDDGHTNAGEKFTTSQNLEKEESHIVRMMMIIR